MRSVAREITGGDVPGVRTIGKGIDGSEINNVIFEASRVIDPDRVTETGDV